jgi:cytochrome c peroxidase
MSRPVTRLGLALALTALVLGLIASVAAAADLTPIEQLGKNLLFDTRLSTPSGQSCATCHAPEVGFTGPDSYINAGQAVYPGAIDDRAGNRKPPTAAYGGDSPILHYDADDEVWVGGMFWDGRASGWTLGDPLAEQAQGPFLNPLEQNMPSAKQVVDAVARSSYSGLFRQVWGDDVLKMRSGKRKGGNVAKAYKYIALSIAAYERSAEVNPFSSKFDLFWDNANAAGMDVTAIDDDNWTDYTGYGLTDDEVYGLAVYNDEDKGMCSACHTLDVGSAGYPLFTDFTYDNLGIPKNPLNPFYMMVDFNPEGIDWIDYGLGAFLKSAGFDEMVWVTELGKVKVPTLRNVDRRPYPEFVKAFGHNGYFKSLEEITHFYNTRDVDPSWPEPEVDMNVNSDELGNLGLTLDEEAAIVLFMTTLSDGYADANGAVAAH